MITIIETIQKKCKELSIDGWLVHDYHGRNQLALDILDIDPDSHLTRPFFYWVPVEGEPLLIQNAIEAHLLGNLPGKRTHYSGYIAMMEKLKGCLGHSSKVAMETSPRGQIPTLDIVPAGIVDAVKSCGVEVVSSGDLLQTISSQLTQEQYESHKVAAQNLIEAFQGAFFSIRTRLNQGQSVTERSVVEFIEGALYASDMVHEGRPICASSTNSANPHYAPEGDGRNICEGDIVLLDLWGKLDKPRAVYADMTVMAVVGGDASEKAKSVFHAVRAAQKAVIDRVITHFKAGLTISGADADRAAREVLIDRGYERYIMHRTGHNIGEELHSCGAHLDSCESIDERKLLKTTCFSVEPGLYIPGELGVRLEADLYVHNEGQVEVTTRLQDQFYTI